MICLIGFLHADSRPFANMRYAVLSCIHINKILIQINEEGKTGMKIKKRIMALTAILIAANILAGCSGKGDKGSGASSKAQQENGGSAAAQDSLQEGIKAGELNIGISMYNMENAFSASYKEKLQKSFEDIGCKAENIIIKDAAGSRDEQTNNVNEFISSGFDAIIIEPVKPSETENYVKQADAAGIPVIIINREPSYAEEGRWATEGIRAAYVGGDVEEAGKMLGNMIAAYSNKGDINGDGTVSYVLLQGDADIIDTGLKSDDCVKAIADAGLGREELFKIGVNYNRAAAKQAIIDVIAKFGDKAEVVFCADTEAALGAVEGAQEAGRSPGENIYIVAVNTTKETCSSISSGKLGGTLYENSTLQAQTAAESSISLINKKAVEARNAFGYTEVTKDNVSEILEQLKN